MDRLEATIDRLQREIAAAREQLAGLALSPEAARQVDLRQIYSEVWSDLPLEDCRMFMSSTELTLLATLQALPTPEERLAYLDGVIPKRTFRDTDRAKGQP